jgi:hypothetical protein
MSAAVRSRDIGALSVASGAGYELLDCIVGGGYAGAMKYPGGKSGSGVFQRIISQMPPHQVYVEAFLGGGAVMRYKRPALVNVGLDIDPSVVTIAAALVASGEWVPPAAGIVGDGLGRPGWRFECVDAVQWLQRWRWWTGTLVYADPPYLMATRSSQRQMYRYELEEPGHVALLDVLDRLPCMVMVSGYESELYCRRLSAWRVVRYPVMTRGGRSREECLWCNFPVPVELHDYRYMGRDFRERERIRRKLARWRAVLSKLPVLEREALVSALVAARSK